MTVEVWVGAFLLLFASIYLGMGFSLVVLQFPGALATTRMANFPERFGDPVRRAVAIFAVMSALMLGGGALVTVLEWDDGARRLFPLLFTVAVLVATAFTVVFILPVNRRLYRQLDSESEFSMLLRRWIVLNVVRFGIWVVEWLAIAAWFVAVALS